MSNNGQTPAGQPGWQPNNDGHEAPTQQAGAGAQWTTNPDEQPTQVAPTSGSQGSSAYDPNQAYGSQPSQGYTAGQQYNASQTPGQYGSGQQYNAGQTYTSGNPGQSAGTYGSYEPPATGGASSYASTQQYGSAGQSGQQYSSAGQSGQAYGTPGQYGSAGQTYSSQYDQNAAAGQYAAGSYGAQYGQGQYGQAGYAQSAGEYASWPARVGAYLIDSLVSGVPMAILYFLGGAVAYSNATQYTDEFGKVHTDGVNSMGIVLMALGWLIGLAISIWNVGFKQGKTGQSIGKKALNIALVKQDTGQFTGVGLSIGRMFAHILDSLPCYLGFLWPLWDAKKQTFADKICNTIVVKKMG